MANGAKLPCGEHDADRDTGAESSDGSIGETSPNSSEALELSTNKSSTEHSASSKVQTVPQAEELKTTSAQSGIKPTDGFADIVAIQALLNQFCHPKVRADFISGQFGISVNRDILPAMDALRWTLFPRWKGGSLSAHSRITLQASFHLHKLISKSERTIQLIDEEPTSYREWFYILESIAENKYWIKVSPEDRCVHIVPSATDNDGSATNKEDSDALFSHLKPVEKETKDSESAVKSTQKKILTKKKSQPKKKVEEITIYSTDLSSDSPQDTDSGGEDEASVRPSITRMKRRDKREVITPPKFKMDGKIHLRDYLPTYEQYFEKKYTGDAHDKTQKLADFIEGDLLTIYNVRGGRSLAYNEMKKQLLAYYKKQKIGGKQFWRKKMEDMRPTSDEGYDVYGLRLIEVAKLAYPSDEKECAKQLRDRFFKNIPSEIVNKIEDTERTLKCSGKKTKRLPFSSVIDMARDIQKRMKVKSTSVMLARDGSQQRYSGDNSSYQQQQQQGAPRRARQFSNSRHRYNSKSNNNKNDSQGEKNQSEAKASSDQNNDVACSWCGLTTHKRPDCWRARKLCLICGKQHLITDCPKYKPDYRGRSQSRDPQPKGNEESLGTTGNNQA